MKKTITQNEFIREFENRNNFTKEGLINLFNYFEEIEEDMNEQFELDVIYICCNYTEYSNIKDLKEDYLIPFEGKKRIREYLEARTQIVSFEEDCIIIINI